MNLDWTWPGRLSQSLRRELLRLHVAEQDRAFFATTRGMHYECGTERSRWRNRGGGLDHAWRGRTWLSGGPGSAGRLTLA